MIAGPQPIVRPRLTSSFSSSSSLDSAIFFLNQAQALVLEYIS